MEQALVINVQRVEPRMKCLERDIKLRQFLFRKSGWFYKKL